MSSTDRTNKMNMKPFLVLTQLLLLSLLASPLSAAEDQPIRRALIIGIDGVRRDALDQAKTPHLDRLRREGAFSAKTAIVASRPTKSDTVSGPGWSSILTGVWSDKHGVVDNKFAGSRYGDYPHFFARLKAHDRAARTVSLVSWKPIQERIVMAADVSEFLDLNGESEARRDEQMAKRAADVLAKTHPTAMFAYLHQVDAAGHRHGFHPSVSQYVEAIENADTCGGVMLDAIGKRPHAKREEWLIAVCTDHAVTQGAASVVVADIDPGRLLWARRFGAMAAIDTSQSPRALVAAVDEITRGRGVDVALEMSGATSAFEAALPRVRVGGCCCVVVGVVRPSRRASVDVDSVVRRMLTLRGVHNYAPRLLVAAVDFLAEHVEAFPFEQLVGGVYPLTHVDVAFRQSAANGDIRGVVKIES